MLYHITSYFTSLMAVVNNALKTTTKKKPKKGCFVLLFEVIHTAESYLLLLQYGCNTARSKGKKKKGSKRRC